MLRGLLSTESHSSTQPAAVRLVISILKRYSPGEGEGGRGREREGEGERGRERGGGERERERESTTIIRSSTLMNVVVNEELQSDWLVSFLAWQNHGLLHTYTY
jgi:hypothetical protein